MNHIDNTWNPTVGVYVSMMRKICVALLGLECTAKLFRLQDHKETTQKTFGMVQTEKFHLQSLRSHGERQFPTGYSDRKVETEFEDMERARMKVTRVCIYHVDHNAAGKSHSITGEIFAHMMFECVCHQVSIVGGARFQLLEETQAGWHIKRPDNSGMVFTACQPVSFG